MTTMTTAPRIFVFNSPAAEHLMEMTVDYYRECRLAGAGSVEVQLPDRSAVIISATRYLPADVDVAAIVTNGVLQVLCTRAGGQRTVLKEFTAWTDFTVHRARR
ncbi:hypothetical protein CKJ70_26325 [Mycobacterium avium]|nr:hypothetical protein CKJ70_26325 [Mycobacterium avium]